MWAGPHFLARFPALSSRQSVRAQPEDFRPSEPHCWRHDHTALARHPCPKEKLIGLLSTCLLQSSSQAHPHYKAIITTVFFLLQFPLGLDGDIFHAVKRFPSSVTSLLFVQPRTHEICHSNAKLYQPSNKCHSHAQRCGESPAASLPKLTHVYNPTGGREAFPWPWIPPIFSLGSNSVTLIHPKINELFRQGKRALGAGSKAFHVFSCHLPFTFKFWWVRLPRRCLSTPNNSPCKLQHEYTHFLIKLETAFFWIILKTLFGVLSLCIYTDSFTRIIYVEFLSHYTVENITCFSSRFLGWTQKYFEEFDHRHLLMENLVTKVGVF